MATYLPNVKDYIPNVKAYTPDFKFLSDSLDQRQDRYNKTTKQLNNLYGDVVYADLSREDNQSVRDEYAKLLAPKIQQISGLDFSLAQNVQAAKGLFKPFYEDEKDVMNTIKKEEFHCLHLEPTLIMHLLRPILHTVVWESKFGS